jgi:CDP-glucose 4,6-dehydratase
LEELVSSESWAGKRVLLTGHTGFKGAWLTMWLHRLGAHVTGLSLPAEPTSLFRQARLDELVDHVEGDIRDLAVVERVVARARPEVVFHLAAQPLVRESYRTPVETFATNVQGTVHVLDACRRAEHLRAIVCVTSDKCYENREWIWPYRENDPMGGRDPYSASKGAAELVIAAYRNSFFQAGAQAVAGLASVRAGNVIGGGDWAEDRLIPDIVRSLLAGRDVEIRSPASVRPWQHVLEALGGYLMIGAQLMQGAPLAASAWNFGPAESDARPVRWIVERMIDKWGEGSYRVTDAPQPHEARLLRLDCSKAFAELGWSPAWTLDDALRQIVDWHRRVAVGEDARRVSLEQLEDYLTKFAANYSRKMTQ